VTVDGGNGVDSAGRAAPGDKPEIQSLCRYVRSEVREVSFTKFSKFERTVVHHFGPKGEVITNEIFGLNLKWLHFEACGH
jgi:hypothetical protein